MRVIAGIVAVLRLAVTSQAQAQFFYSRGMIGGGPNFFGGGAGPIPRETVVYPTNYARGTLLRKTAERRLYLVLGSGEALRYGIGVGRDGFRWSGVHRISAKREWADWTPPPHVVRPRP